MNRMVKELFAKSILKYAQVHSTNMSKMQNISCVVTFISKLRESCKLYHIFNSKQPYLRKCQGVYIAVYYCQLFNISVVKY